MCGLESLVRSCRSSLADGLWIVDGFQGPGWVLERNEAGESQELKAMPLCLLTKKRREERRTEKVKVEVEVEVEVKERISCSVRGETGNSRAWAVSRFICDVPHRKARSKFDWPQPGMLPPAGPSSHPALAPRHLQDPIKY